MDVTVLLTTIALVVPVELPDKTFLASLVLATRYRPLPVWIGVSAAFLVQCIVAVAAGSLITRLPRAPLLIAAGLLFAVAGVVLLRGAAGADKRDAEETAEDGQSGATPQKTQVSGLRAAGASFAVLFLAEWGDLSQLMTAALVVRTKEPWSVLVGSWLALAFVAGLAVLLGRALLRRVRLATVSRVGGVISLVIATLTFVQLL